MVFPTRRKRAEALCGSPFEVALRKPDAEAAFVLI